MEPIVEFSEHWSRPVFPDFLHLSIVVIVFQSISPVQLFASPWTAAHQAPLSFTVSWGLLKLMSIESVILCNHLVFCCPLLSPSVFPSIRIFCKELTLHIRWPKYWSFSISPSSEYSGLISFRIDWFCLFAVQRLNSHHQQYSPKHQILVTQPSLRSSPHSMHDYQKNHSLD